MALTGHVKDGVIQFDSPAPDLKDGMAVEIIPISSGKDITDTISGAWEDDRSAEEIIQDINNSRKNKEYCPDL